MARVVISEFMDEPAIDWLRARHDVTYDPTLIDDPAALRAACAEASALIVRNRTQVDAALMDAAPGLRAIGRLGVGLDNIDTETAKARGVAVFPATGGNVTSVAEYVITAVMVLRRGAWLGSADVLSGAWPRQRMMGLEVAGATLGLVGFGAIAQATAERARALGMSVAAYDPFLPADASAWDGAARFDDLDALVGHADALSLHVPLTDTTRGLFGADRLAAMKPGAVLINTARGQIVDESALADALRAGHLGGAAMDVFASEPLGAGSPLAGAPNLIATPHIAGVTVESNTRISLITVRNVDGALGG
ncbi:(S)-sulfolactate dehydrogenase [Roseibaca ekhonensis]|jgi:(S)-sulfolactate dehydrogenase|uniref:(S)-sulfolactate dehydrogenase n=1 Tax=Roseinatronobacter ekhonensis TaxID=254356 RepID=A0A3B0MNI9_9RHOB|nr:hydroxyacid dehydrogenase [Roseibaca ekhonensis]SUZ30494.1 (S)-sulfolactate dehydrogenase [Roseibaca ekhonensis]